MNKGTTKLTMMTTWGNLREQILNAPRWYVNIDLYDLKWFEGDNAEDIIVIESETTDISEYRREAKAKFLIDQIMNTQGHTAVPKKVLIYIQCPNSSPLTVEVLKAIQDLMEETVPSDCEYMWALSPREDGMSRIVCAIH